MAVGIERRRFVAGLGGSAVAWPLAALAQQTAMPVVGFLSSRSPDESKHLVAAFRTGLQTGGGYVEGQNVAIEYRWVRAIGRQIQFANAGNDRELEAAFATLVE